MATNAPLTRKTHICRICGTNKNGDQLSDIWVDLERWDVAKKATQASDGTWQGLQRKFVWWDDPDSDQFDPNGNPARVMEIVKVCSPDEDNVDDPEEWVPVPVIKSLRASGGGSQDDANGQHFQDRLRNSVTSDELNEARIVEVRRIVHCDTNIDDAAQAAFDADPTRTNYVVTADDYTKDLSSKDTDQYVEHEIIMYLKHRTNERDVSSRGLQTKLLNQYQIDDSEDADGAVTGNNGINPPYRLDPYHNIINCKFSRSVIVVVNAASYYLTGGDPSYTILDQSVKFLGSRPMRYQASGFAPNVPAWAFKVSTGAGVTGQSTKGAFININLPALPAGVLENPVIVGVFAYDAADPTGSLNRALDGMQLMTVGYQAGGVSMGDVTTGSSDLPSQVAPPGMLWNIYFGQGSGPVPLKIRFGPHRGDKQTSPPDNMVQVYPLMKPGIISGSDFQAGYLLGAYRLDKDGTGQSYGVGLNQFADGGSINTMDPIVQGPQGIPGVLLYGSPWGQTFPNAHGLNYTGWYGVPYSDPPPFISQDPPSTGGGYVGPFSDH